MSFNKSLCVALGVLAATSVMAYEQSFETGTTVGNPLDLAGWGGYGTYSNTVDQTLAAGTPIAGAHTKHLAVDGWVTNTLEGTAGDAQLDMLVKVARPDEELSGMSDNEAKFAMAIDLDGTLKYWTGEAWSALGATTYAEGQWIRVAVIYNAAGANSRCKVSVDGNACVTETGFKAATGDETGGAWYPVIQAATKIASLKVVGTTALDDVKVAYNSNSSYVPEYKDASGNDIVVAQTGGVNVPMSWFDQNSIATNVTTATDGSGMTIADKYQTGMDPNSGETFAMKSMTMTESAGTVTATVTVPACTPPTGAVKIQTSANKSAWTDGATLAPGATSAPVTLGSGNVTYFRMVLDK